MKTWNGSGNLRRYAKRRPSVWIRHLLNICTIFFLFLPLSTRSQPLDDADQKLKETAKNLYNSAKKFFDERRYKQALKLYTQARDTLPDEAKFQRTRNFYLFFIGRTYVRLGEKAKARKALEEYRRKGVDPPNRVELLELLAEVKPGTPTLRRCPAECSGHGTCNLKTGVCVCEVGYAGKACATCYPGYTGYPACHLIKTCPLDCSKQGTCDPKTGLCSCKEGYAGAACDRCAEGYIGYPTCRLSPQSKGCPQNCGGRGHCDTKTGVCTCKEGYAGAACDVCAPTYLGFPDCYLPKSCPSGCSGHGRCDAKTGVCACKEGYAGAACNACALNYVGYPDCYPQKRCPEDCSGHGRCDTKRGVCSCNPGYTGESCDRCVEGLIDYPTCGSAPRYEALFVGGGGLSLDGFLQFSWQFASIFSLYSVLGLYYSVGDLEVNLLRRYFGGGFLGVGLQLTIGDPWRFVIRFAPALGFGSLFGTEKAGFTLVGGSGLLYRFRSGFLLGVSFDLHWTPLTSVGSFLGFGFHFNLGYAF